MENSDQIDQKPKKLSTVTAESETYRNDGDSTSTSEEEEDSCSSSSSYHTPPPTQSDAPTSRQGDEASATSSSSSDCSSGSSSASLSGGDDTETDERRFYCAGCGEVACSKDNYLLPKSKLPTRKTRTAAPAGGRKRRAAPAKRATAKKLPKLLID